MKGCDKLDLFFLVGATILLLVFEYLDHRRDRLLSADELRKAEELEQLKQDGLKLKSSRVDKLDMTKDELKMFMADTMLDYSAKYDKSNKNEVEAEIVEFYEFIIQEIQGKL